MDGIQDWDFAMVRRPRQKVITLQELKAAYASTGTTPEQKLVSGHRLCGLGVLCKSAGCPLGEDEESVHAWAAIVYSEYAAGYAEGWDGYPCCLGIDEHVRRRGWNDGREHWMQLGR